MAKVLKVAEIVGHLNRGGVETWLKNVSAYYDKRNIRIDFVKFTKEESAYDRFVEEQGSQIIEIPKSEGWFKFVIGLYLTFRRGNYDIVHSHVQYFNGLILLIAFMAGVKHRISHSHLASEDRQGVKKIYVSIMKLLIALFASNRIACSKEAGMALFGNKPFDILYCGVDFSIFHKAEKSVRNLLLEKNGLPDDGIYIGHVGRFEKQKNHSFLLDIFYEFQKLEPRAHLLLIGTGSLLEEIETKTRRLGLKNVHFWGSRDDVCFWMRDVFDMFLFPSLYEGLGLVLLEAQAAGVPSLISDTIPKEAVIVPELINRLSLKETSKVWARYILQIYSSRTHELNRENLKDTIEHSPFGIRQSVACLESLYNDCVKERFDIPE
jgi:glycosyltransferase involved in cell wall biosynthesis